MRSGPGSVLAKGVACRARAALPSRASCRRAHAGV